MKYFFDTEFIEGFHKPLFGKKRHFIDLISIGIVAEDGREYYAISNEFNRRDADDWVKEHVIDKLEQRATSFYDSPRLKQNCRLYKTNSQIAQDIVAFCYPHDFKEINKVEFLDRSIKFGWNDPHPEFYAYYADYDWVVFCSLFGRMIDLPKGFPMYCRDLKQILDQKQESRNRLKGYIDSTKGALSHHEEHSMVYPLNLKDHVSYPKQENEHNALADAKWNKKLYDFLVAI